MIDVNMTVLWPAHSMTRDKPMHKNAKQCAMSQLCWHHDSCTQWQQHQQMWWWRCRQPVTPVIISAASFSCHSCQLQISHFWRKKATIFQYSLQQNFEWVSIFHHILIPTLKTVTWQIIFSLSQSPLDGMVRPYNIGRYCVLNVSFNWQKCRQINHSRTIGSNVRPTP